MQQGGLARNIAILDLARMNGHPDSCRWVIYYNPTAEEIAEQRDKLSNISLSLSRAAYYEGIRL